MLLFICAIQGFRATTTRRGVHVSGIVTSVRSSEEAVFGAPGHLLLHRFYSRKPSKHLVCTLQPCMRLSQTSLQVPTLSRHVTRLITPHALWRLVERLFQLERRERRPSFLRLVGRFF